MTTTTDRADRIYKSPSEFLVRPNFVDYETERSEFSWGEAARLLGAYEDDMCNIAALALDRHAIGPLRDRTAFRFVNSEIRNGEFGTEDISYGELAEQARRFTNVLRRLGIGKGDTMFVVAGRIPALYYGILGALRNGTVVSPMFSAFGPEPIATRVRLGEGTVMLTTEKLYRRKIAKVRETMPSLRHILLIDEDGSLPKSPARST